MLGGDILPKSFIYPVLYFKLLHFCISLPETCYIKGGRVKGMVGQRAVDPNCRRRHCFSDAIRPQKVLMFTCNVGDNFLPSLAQKVRRCDFLRPASGVHFSAGCNLIYTPYIRVVSL